MLPRFHLILKLRNYMSQLQFSRMKVYTLQTLQSPGERAGSFWVCRGTATALGTLRAEAVGWRRGAGGGDAVPQGALAAALGTFAWGGGLWEH